VQRSFLFVGTEKVVAVGMKSALEFFCRYQPLAINSAHSLRRAALDIGYMPTMVTMGVLVSISSSKSDIASLAVAE
jgi:hypothetical protein